MSASEGSTTQETSNKGTFQRVLDATNSHDGELISKTIDEAFLPDVLFSTPLPLDVTGAEAIKEVFARLHRAFPDLHIAVEDVIAEGGQGRQQAHGYRDPPGRIPRPPANR